MKMIHEMRQRPTWQAHRRANPLPIILGAVLAFGIGLLGVSGIVRAPALFPPKTQTVPVMPRDALSALRDCAPEGRLTASAAERFAPVENAKALRDTEVSRDACTGHGQR